MNGECGLLNFVLTNCNYKIMKRSTATLTGILFLVPLLTYSIGTALLDSAHPGTENTFQVLFGALLIFLNSVTVTVLGVLLFPVLEQRSKTVALGYLSARSMEALLLVIGLVGIITPLLYGPTDPSLADHLVHMAKEEHFWYYQLAMIILAAGSIGFCAVLYKLNSVPCWLAVAGLIGYSLLAIGAFAELFGYKIGVLLSLPGGLFEIALGIRLIAKGFKPAR